MSNHFAIATVTAWLLDLLGKIQADLNKPVDITTNPPDIVASNISSNPILGLFLYQVTPNSGYANTDLPTRDSRGSLVGKPHIGLNLHYLLTIYAANDDFVHQLERQEILASAIRILNENPVLSREKIQSLKEGLPNIVGKTDLEDQIELVKNSLSPLSLEDITKLWTAFQIPYRTSVKYEVNVVLLDSKKEPKATLPVKKPLLRVVQFRYPIIDKIEPQIIEAAAADAKLAIKGRNLAAEIVKVRIGGKEIGAEPESIIITDHNIVINVLPSGLTAGIKPVRVVHKLALNSSSNPYTMYESNTVAFVLAPRIMSSFDNPIPRKTEITIVCEPAVEPKQKVSLLIGEVHIPITSHQSQTNPVQELSVTIPEDLPVGKFLVRVRVDRAESLLQVDEDPNSETFGMFIGPTIEITK